MMIEITAYAVMRYSVFLIALISVIFSLKTRKGISGYHKDVFDKMLFSLLLFATGIAFHVIRAEIWDVDLLRIPEHLMILLSLIFALDASFHVMSNKDEWGLHGI